MSDINEKLVKTWDEDTQGRDVCVAMTDRLNGVLSLQTSAPETFEELKAKGFDNEKIASLIAERCEQEALRAEELPEAVDVAEEIFDEEDLD